MSVAWYTDIKERFLQVLQTNDAHVKGLMLLQEKWEQEETDKKN